MRVCWNRQTGTFEGRVSTDVWVQVPLLAPYLLSNLDVQLKKSVFTGFFSILVEFLNQKYGSFM